MTNPASLAVRTVSDVYSHYRDYFRSIPATTHADRFRRFLFAYTTVNLSWETSVELYSRIGWLSWPYVSEAELKSHFMGIGFHNTMPARITEFASAYWKDPFIFETPAYPVYRDWANWRRYVSGKTRGLGITKFSFAAEMLEPEQCRIVCLDRHMLKKVFGVDPAKQGPAGYQDCETQWCEASEEHGMEPALTRLAYWDSMQGFKSPAFWAHVLAPIVDNN